MNPPSGSAGERQEQHQHDPNKLDRNEQLEYSRIIQMLDYRQHLNVPAHLYSAYLLSKRKPKPKPGKRLTRQIPHNKWTAWPLRDAPCPPQIYDDMPDDQPSVVDEKYVEDLRQGSSEKFPMGPDPSDPPSSVLLRACNEFFQRTINQRVHHERNDNNEDLEPVVEPEPSIDSVSSARLLNLIDKYANPVPPKSSQKRNNLIGWEQLGVQGKTAERSRRLFNREVDEDLNSEEEGDGSIEYFEESLDDTTIDGLDETEDKVKKEQDESDVDRSSTD